MPHEVLLGQFQKNGEIDWLLLDKPNLRGNGTPLTHASLSHILIDIAVLVADALGLIKTRVLTLERFKELVVDPNVVFPAITPAQIKDRSKGDGLSKLLAILQRSWFILQCIARGFQGLALTELELVTLAMTSLNAITFAFWWSKPLSVQEPVDVYVMEPSRVARETSNRNSSQIPYTARDIIYRTRRDLLDDLRAMFKPYQRKIYISWLMNFLVAIGEYLLRLPIRLLRVLTYPARHLFSSLGYRNGGSRTDFA